MQQLTLALSPPPPPTFENFFAARNAAALAALQSLVSSVPADPVVLLYGAAGSGRSHLLQATVSAVRSAGLTAVWATPGGEDLAHASFDLRIDLIAADNVDAMNDTEQIQLFDAFNRQRASGGRFLASAAAPAGRLAVREDLRSRLASGLAIELLPLSEEERLAVLQGHATDRAMQVATEVFDYIARRAPRDLGTQIAVLDALDRISLEKHRPISIVLAREVLQQLGHHSPLRTD